jgi:Holliday junction resolvase RusA-like endonuclease
MIIELLGPPIPRKRARHSSAGNFVRTYDPQHKEMLATRVKLQDSIDRVNKKFELFTDFESPMHVSLTFFLPLATSLSLSNKNLRLWTNNDVAKPDLDNLAKFYLDAGNGILWEDDSQITALSVKKYYSNQPKTLIKIVRNMVTLDEKAQGILSSLSPEEFLDIHLLVADLNQILEQGSRLDQEGDSHHRQIWTSRAARVLSKLADNHSRTLNKIHKKYPGYWFETERSFGEGKVPC